MLAIEMSAYTDAVAFAESMIEIAKTEPELNLHMILTYAAFLDCIANELVASQTDAAVASVRNLATDLRSRAIVPRTEDDQ